MQADLKKSMEGNGQGLPPKWRLAVSARPTFWDATTSARCHAYNALKAKGEASVRYVLATEDQAHKILALMLERVAERRTERDHDELSLFSWAKGGT